MIKSAANVSKQSDSKHTSISKEKYSGKEFNLTLHPITRSLSAEQKELDPHFSIINLWE